MSKGKFKTYCRIIDYLDEYESELAELLRGTCTDIALNTGKGKPGVTFLIPQDKALVDKIRNLAYSDKVADANKAADMLNAMIFRDVYKTASDWDKKKSNIPNSLFPSQHVDIKSASGKEVTFASGAKAVLDEKFQDASRRGNLAVWKLVSGEIPVTTDKPAKRDMPMKGKMGAYEVSNAESQALRWKIAVYVENLYMMQEIQRRVNNSTAHTCAFLEYSCSLLLHIHSVDKNQIAQKLLPMIACDKLDFYFLLEPHKTSGNYLISDSLIADWWTNPQVSEAACARCKQLIEQLLMSGGTAAVYSRRPELMEAIHKIRKQVTEETDARGRDCVSFVTKVYQRLALENCIGDVTDVYPADLAAVYAAEPGLKMLQDEIRYTASVAFLDLESQPVFDPARMSEIVNMIGDSMHVVLNAVKLKYMIQPGDHVRVVKEFIWSTCFLHMPMTKAECDNMRVKNSVSRPKPSSGVVYNIAALGFKSHDRIVSQAGKQLANMLEMLDVKNMDPALKEAIKAKLA